MSHFSYYEGDQSKLYSGSHHLDKNSAESKAQVKRIWMITLWLSVITIVEVIIGLMFSHHMPKGLVAAIFLALTMVKAGMIVSVFMHLGDEFKGFMMTILLPLSFFIWFIIAFLSDGSFWLKINSLLK